MIRIGSSETSMLNVVINSTVVHVATVLESGDERKIVIIFLGLIIADMIAFILSNSFRIKDVPKYLL